MSKIDYLFGFHAFLNLLQLNNKYCLILISAFLQGQLQGLLGKNLSLYSPIGALLVMSLVRQAINVFEHLCILSHELPLV